MQFANHKFTRSETLASHLFNDLTQTSGCFTAICMQDIVVRRRRNNARHRYL